MRSPGACSDVDECIVKDLTRASETEILYDDDVVSELPPSRKGSKCHSGGPFTELHKPDSTLNTSGNPVFDWLQHQVNSRLQIIEGKLDKLDDTVRKHCKPRGKYHSGHSGGPKLDNFLEGTSPGHFIHEQADKAFGVTKSPPLNGIKHTEQRLSISGAARAAIDALATHHSRTALKRLSTASGVGPARPSELLPGAVHHRDTIRDDQPNNAVNNDHAALYHPSPEAYDGSRRSSRDLQMVPKRSSTLPLSRPSGLHLGTSRKNHDCDGSSRPAPPRMESQDTVEWNSEQNACAILPSDSDGSPQDARKPPAEPSLDYFANDSSLGRSSLLKKRRTFEEDRRQIRVLAEEPEPSGMDAEGETVFSVKSSRTSMPVMIKKQSETVRSGCGSMSERTSGKRRTLTATGMTRTLEAFNELPHAFQTERDQHIIAVWTFLDDPESSQGALIYAKARKIFILLTVLISFLQTPDPPLIHGFFVAVLETFFDCCFIIEIVLRFIVCPSKLNFICDLHNWVDVLAGASLSLRVDAGFILSDLEHNDIYCFVLLCVLPIVRLLTMLRHFETFHLLTGAFWLAFEALPVLLFLLLVITLVFSSAIYIVEPRSNIASLPKAVWLSIVTMTSVGYGDVTPESSIGDTIAAALAILSLLFLAMPLGIIGSCFNEVWQDRDRILLVKRTRQRLDQWGYTARDIPVLFRIVDVDQDGALDLEEFRHLIKHMKIGLRDDRVVQLFAYFDIDNSGTVDSREFVRLLFPRAYMELYSPGGEHEDMQGSEGSDEDYD